MVYRFASDGTARAWEDSTTKWKWTSGRWASPGRRTDRSVPGSKAWFDSQSPAPRTPAPPSKWKLWFVNMSAVFPPVLLFNLIALPYLGGLNPIVRTLLLCLCVTALVTWILMPRLQRFFKKWLYPPLQALRGRHKRRTA